MKGFTVVNQNAKPAKPPVTNLKKHAMNELLGYHFVTGNANTTCSLHRLYKLLQQQQQHLGNQADS